MLRESVQTQKIISICKKINKPILLIGGPKDIDRGKQIINETTNTHNTCGKYTVLQMMVF